MGLVVVDRKHDGVVAGPRSGLARLDRPAHAIIEGARDGPAVLVGVRVDLVTRQRAAGRAAGVGLGLRGVGPAMQRLGGLHRAIATRVVAVAVADGLPIKVSRTRGYIPLRGIVRGARGLPQRITRADRQGIEVGAIVVGTARVVRVRPGAAVDRNRVPSRQRTAATAIERGIGRSHAVHHRQRVAIGIVILVLLDGSARLTGGAIARAGRRPARRRQAVARALIIGHVLAPPHPPVVIVGLAVGDCVYCVERPAPAGIVGRIGPLVGQRVQRGGEIGAARDLLGQVVIDPRGHQSPARAVVIVGVVVFDPRRRAAARLLGISGSRALHDDFAGRVGHRGRTAGVGVGRIAGDRLLQQRRGGGAGAAVDILLGERATQEVLRVRPGRVPALGAVVAVHRQVMGRAGDVDLREALVLAMVVVLPVAVPFGQPVIADTVLVLVVLVGITVRACPHVGPRLGQQIAVERGGLL